MCTTLVNILKNKMDKVAIYIPDSEAKQFLLFQKHYELFIALEQSGALNIGYGNCVINFAGGVVQNISKNEVVYKR